MKLTKKNREILFWTTQILGWLAVGLLILILPIKFTTTYKIYSIVVGSFVGITTTSLYRHYLKNNIDFEVFGKGSVKRFFVAFLACSAFYYFLSSMVEELYEVLWTRTEFEIAFLEKNSGFFLGMFNYMITIFGWTIIYFVIKFILEASKNRLKEIELNTTLREAQLNTLKGQVNPHFMFNSLNNIRGLMLEDVDKSRDMITKLSEMLEYAVEKNTVDAISLEEELEMVDNYIALSKIQMEERLQFSKNIEPKTLTVSIPPMIIQLLVENAAKHGIATLKNGGAITLKTKTISNQLSITVANTGALKIAEDSTQLGLKNIRQRLRLLYGDKASFSLEEIDGEVVANIKIPLI